MLGREGTEQPYLHQTDLLPLGQQALDHLFTGANRRAHQHHNPLRLRVANVFKWPVVAAGLFAKSLHRLAHMAIGGVIPRVARLPALEVGVRVGGGAANDRFVGGERPVTMGTDGICGQQGTQGVVSERRYLGDLVRGTKAVEEVDKGEAAVEARYLGDQGKVLRLLHIAGTEHGTAGLAHRHHVRVIAKDR